MRDLFLFACGICSGLGFILGSLCTRPPDKPDKPDKPRVSSKTGLVCALCKKWVVLDTSLLCRAQGWRRLPGHPGPTCPACVAARGRRAVIASVRFGGNWIQKWK